MDGAVPLLLGDIIVAAYMIWQLRRKTNVVPLRCYRIVADNTALSIGMAGAGEGGIVIGVYLWVTIGNGFASALDFCSPPIGCLFLVLVFSSSSYRFGSSIEWSVPVCFLAGAIVPLYVLVLLIRLTGQKEAAEQLSNAKSRFVASAMNCVHH